MGDIREKLMKQLYHLGMPYSASRGSFIFIILSLHYIITRRRSSGPVVTLKKEVRRRVDNRHGGQLHWNSS